MPVRGYQTKATEYRVYTVRYRQYSDSRVTIDKQQVLHAESAQSR